MKTCKKCNLTYEDDKKFCKECGSILTSIGEIGSMAIILSIGGFILFIILTFVLFAIKYPQLFGM